MATSNTSAIRKIGELKFLRILLLSGFLLGFVNTSAKAQCTLTGVSGSGFNLATFCAPAYTSLYYEFTFGTVAPPQPTYIIKFFWGDGSAIQSVGGTVQTKIVSGFTVYFVRVEKDHTFPAAGLCEYSVNMFLYDEFNNQCPDSRQVQIVANWHEDDVAAASGVIALNPTPRKDVCEGLPLLDFQFTDASRFACNLQQYPTAQKPNHSNRFQQYIYGTNPVAGRGIPNLYIKVGVAGTIVYLTQANGDPVANSWNVDPVTGAIVGNYTTTSGYFEGPKVTVPVNGATGVYSLSPTYRISFDGVGAVFQDQFQVTVRNWNNCNPVTPNLATSLIYIINGPTANAGADATICANGSYTLNGSVVDATSSLWTKPGAADGILTNATSPNGATYTPGTNDKIAGFVDLTLHAYAGGLCTEHIDVMRLSFEALPATPTISINAGSNNFCDNDVLSITLRSTVSANGYLWSRNGTSTGILTRDITLNDYTQAGDYTVTVYNNSVLDCPNTSAPFTVTIGQPATVGAGADQTICSSTTASVAGSRGGGASTSTWSTSGTGTFANASQLNTTYTPSNADKTAGSVTLTITTNDPTGPCTAVSDNLVVTINPAATSDAGADQSVCSSSPAVSLTGAIGGGATTSTWSSSGSGTFVSATSLNTTYNPSATDISTGSVTLTLLTNNPTGPCNAVSDAMVVTIYPVATVGAGIDQTICSTGTVSVTGSRGGGATTSTWSTSGTGTFANASQLNTTYTPSSDDKTAGTVTLTITTNDPTGPCTAVSDALVVTINPAATVNAGPDQTICSLASATLAGTFGGGATTVTWTGGAGTYAPGNTSPTAVYTPSAGERGTGTVTLTLTTNNPSGPCGPASDNVTITIGSTPSAATLTGSGNICVGAGASSIKSVITGGKPPYDLVINGYGPYNDYVSGTDINLGILGLGAHTYTITSLTDDCGNTLGTLPAAYTITAYAVPVAAAGPDQYVCGGVVANLAAVATVGTGTWTKQAGPAGVVTFSNSNSASSTATVPSYGTYTFRWTEVNGGICSSFDDVVVAYSQQAAAGADQYKCGTTIATLAGNTPSAGTGTWTKVGGPAGVVVFSNANSATSTATVPSYGTYTFRWTIVNGPTPPTPGCSTNDEVIITYSEAAAAGPDQYICAATVATLAGNTPTSGTGTWTKVGGPAGVVTFSDANSATSTATVPSYGTYTFRWTIVNGPTPPTPGCSTLDEVVIAYSQQAAAGADQYICGTTVATLAGNTPSAGTGTWTKVGGPAGVVVFSNANSATSTATVPSYGTYTFRWTIVNGPTPPTPGCSTNDEVIITYSEAATAGPDQYICAATVATLAGNTPTAGTGTWTKVGGPAGVVTFSDANSATSTATVPSYGTYTFRWTIVNGPTPPTPGCSTLDEVVIAYSQQAAAGADQYICGTTVATLAGNTPSAGTGTWTKVGGPAGVVTFSNANSATSTATVPSYGTYTFRWTIVNGPTPPTPGCSTFDEVIIAYSQQAAAGVDQNICGAKIATLAGNSPTVGTGTWTKESGPGTVTFSNLNLATSTATVSAYGTYMLRWTIVNGPTPPTPGCSTFDDIVINYYEQPTANAGPDNEINALSYILTATPFPYAIAPDVNSGTYTWSLISSSTGGTVTNWGAGANTPTPTITLDKFGDYVFRWTETNGTCSHFDEILLRVVEGANAGPDQDLCNVLFTTLAGNTPSIGTGTWSKISGSGTVTFVDGVNNPATQITVSQYDTYVLQWTFSIGIPPANQDQVTIDFNELPTVNAGFNYNTCFPPTPIPTITLSGTIGGGATSGTWSLIANGTGTVGASTTTGTTVTAVYSLVPSDAGKTITFRLTTDDPTGACPSVFDEVDVHINPMPVTSPIIGEAILCTNATNKIYQVTTPRTAGSTYVWTVPAGITVTSPAGLYFIIVDATGPTAPGAKITVTETLPGPTFCTGLPVEFLVVVTTAKIGEVVAGPSPVCEGSTLNNYSVSFTAGSTYEWSLPPGAFITTVPNNQSSVNVTFPINMSGQVSVVETNGACKTFHLPLPVTVNPRPVLSSSLTPPAICSGTAFNYTATSITGGASFAWTRAGILGINGGTGSAGAGNVNEVLTNTSTTPISVTYVYTTSAGGCTGNPQNVVVTVNPSGQVNDPADLVMCNGTATPAVVFTTNNSGGSTAYAWTNSAPGIGLLASGTGNIASFTATNATTAPVVATITVTPTFTNGSISCVGPDQTFTITVNPTAQVTDPANQVVCNNTLTAPVIFATVNTVGTTTYTWTNSAAGIGLGAGGSGDIAAFTAINAGTSPIVATITVTPHFLNATVTCDGPAQTFTITVNPTGQVNDPADKLVCNGSPVSVLAFTSNNTGGVTTYDWTNNNATINLAASGSGNISTFNAVNLGTSQVTATITVTPTFTNGLVSCIGLPETFTITVNPSGKVTDPSDQVLCNGSNISPVTFATTNLDGTTTYSWTNTAPGIGLPATGAGDIAAFAADNSGNSPVVATIAVTPHYTNGALTCDGPVQSFTITVNPTGQVNDPADQVVCNGFNTAAVNFTTNKTGGVTTYSWTNDNTSINLLASGTGNIPSFAAVNTGTSPVTATITVTPHFDNGAPVCDGPVQTFTITVNPTAQVNDPVDQVVCNGASTSNVTFATTTTGGTTNYTWTNDLVSIGLGASGSGNIPFFTASNATTAPVTANIIVTPHYTNGSVTCDGPAQTFTITVNPTAQVNDPANQVICNGAPVAPVIFATLNTVGTTTYTWTNSAPGIGLVASGTGDIATFDGDNTGTSPIVATIVVTPHFLNGAVTCDGPAQTFTITVNPTGQVNDPSDQVVCNNTPVTAITFGSVNTGGLTTYNWTNSAPGIGIGAGGSGSIASFTALNAGTIPIVATITVTPTFTNGTVSCVGPSENFTITINPTGQVNDPVDQVVCNGGSTAGVTFATVNTVGVTTYSWTNSATGIGLAASGTGNIGTFTASNITTSPVIALISVTPHFANGSVTCDGPSQTFTITVNPSGQVNDPADQVVCNGLPSAAVIFTTNNTGGTTTYTWTNTAPGIGLPAAGLGDIGSFLPINGGTAPVTATITVTPHFDNGAPVCDGPTQTFTITVNPTGQVNTPANQVVCKGSSTSTVIFSTTNTVGTTTYTWTNSTPGIGLAASGSGNITAFSATNAGTTPLVATLVVTPHFINGSVTCDGPTASFTITVNPTAQVNDPVNQVVCNGLPVAAVNFTTVNTGGTTTFNWVNDNTNIGLAPSGSGNILSFNGINTGTSPEVATIVVTPSFDDGSVSCTGPSQSFTITVNPSGQVNDPVNQVVCNGSNTAAVSFTTANSGGTTTYSWASTSAGIGLAASGTTGTIPTFTALNAGIAPLVETITVTPHFTNGSVTCDGPVQTFTITVNPTAHVNDPANQVVCNGLPTAAVTFTTNNLGGTVTYNWTNNASAIGLAASGSGSIASFNANNPGTSPVIATITVTPTFDNGSVSCSGPSQTFTITVNPTGQVNDPANQVICNGSLSTLVSFSTTNSGGATTYTWVNDNTAINLGMGATGNIPAFTATNATLAPIVANITVTPHYTNGSVTCDGPAETFTITVNPSGDVVDPVNQALCNGETTNLVTFTTGNTGGTTTYSWTNSATGIGLPSSGVGDIAPFVASNITSTPIVATITVTPHFTNGSVTCNGPVQIFTITVNPTAQIIDPADETVCAGDMTTAVIFGTLNTGGTTTYNWTNSTPGMGLGAAGTGDIVPFAALNAGTAPVTATITVTPTFTNGTVTCTGPSQTFTITVNPAGQVNDPANQVVCSSSSTATVLFGTVNTGGSTTYSWTNDLSSIGLAASGTGSIPFFTATNGGTAPVVATIEVTPHYTNNSVTCDGTPQTFTITVNPKGQVNDPANQVVCNGLPTTLVTFGTLNTGGITTYTWVNNTPGIGMAASGTGPTIAPFNAINLGTSPVTATITVTPHFDNGAPVCDGTAETFTITVNPTAQVNDPADQVVCNGGPVSAVNFSTNNLGGNTTYTWVNSAPGMGLGAGGTGNISTFNAINSGTVPIVATVTVTPHFLNGAVTCDGPVETFTITVNPTAQVIDPADQVVCNGFPTTLVTFGTLNTGGTTTYTWTNSASGIGLAASGSGDIASFNAVNTSTAPIVASIVITPHFDNGSVTCNGPTQTFTITVNPTAQVNDPANLVVCNTDNVSVTFTTGNTGGLTTYAWTNSTPGIGLLALGTGNSITFTASNITTAPVTATITVTPTFTNGVACAGPDQTFTITVNPTGQVNDPVDQVVCNGTFTAPVNFITVNAGGATTYTWTNDQISIGLAAAGTGNISAFPAVNTGTSPVTATITVIPHFSNSLVNCDGPAQTFTITVNPTAQVTDPADQVVCNGDPVTVVTFTTVNTGGATTYAWTNSAPGIGLPASGTGNTTTFTASNATTAPIVATITVTPTFNNGLVNCIGPAQTFTITVNPTGQVNVPANQVVCNGTATTAINFTTSNTGGTTTYDWVNSASGFGLAASGTGNIASFTAINTGTTPIVATITVTPHFANGSVTCDGPNETFTITVNPTPIVSTASPLTICSASTTNIALTSNIAGATFTWTVGAVSGGITGASASSGSTISQILINPGTTTGSVTYAVIPTAGGCSGLPVNITVAVNPTPNVSTVGPTTICSATSTNIALSSSVAGTTFTWTIGANTGGITGAAPAGGSNIAQILTNPGTTAETIEYIVTPIANSCPGAPVSVVITVNPTPNVTTASSTTICSSTTTNIALTSGVAGTTFSWTIGGVTGSVSGATASNGTTIAQTLYNTGLTPGTVTYIVTPTANSCSGLPTNIVVTVNPSTGPTSFTTGAPEVCQDGPDETYTAEATNSTSILYSVLPATAGTINATTGVMDWAPAYYGNATITATSAGLCGTTVGTVTVKVKRLPSIAASPAAAVTCEFGQVNFDVTADGDYLSYEWQVDPNTGTFATVSGGIYSGIASRTLQIWSADRTMNNYKYRVVVSGCLPDVTSLAALLTVNTSPELTVHPKDSTICLGAGTTMNAASVGTGIVWKWYVNKGVGGFVPVVADTHFSFATTISSDTTKTTLTITDALSTYNNWIFRAQAKGTCGAAVNTNFARLSVKNPPTVALQPVLKVICENGNTFFLGNGSGYMNLQWQVSTNSGTSWTNIVDDAVTYVGAATNQLSVLNAPVTLNNNQYRLAFVGACTTVYSNGVTLTVNPNPIVNFTTDINACGGVPAVLNGNPSGGTLPYAQHRWTGDVGPLNLYTVQSPTFSSQISGTYTLIYKVTDSKTCSASDTLNVIVDSPSSEFTNDIENGCTPLPVVFTKDMTGIAKFWWDFNDGSPLDSLQSSPTHIFVNNSKTSIGYYNVKLKVRSPGGCIKTYSSLVTVYPAVKPGFTASADSICSGKSITFTGVSGASKYFWEFGDGVSAYAGSNSTHLYVNPGPAPMDLNVKLTTTSFYSCNADTTVKIVVMPVPDVQFSADPVTHTYIAGGNLVSFTNLTNAGNWTYLWNFDDGTTSTDKSPSHTYSDLGDYEVTLEVTNGSCTDKVMHEVRVTPIPPVASFDSIPPACEPVSITFNNTSLNTETPGTTYFWEFGDGGISTAKNPEYTYFDPGIYVVKLTVRGPGGVDDAKRTIYVNASPKAYFEVAPLFVFVNDEKIRGFNLTTPSTGNTYLWEFGDGDTSHVKEPFHKYMEPGVFDITLWAFSENGCSDKYILSPGVTVEPAGDIRFSTVFTPNKDGEIDGNMDNVNSGNMDMFFYPPIQEKVQKYKLQIFNRLGVLLFESRNINNAWNGYYKGKLCPQGVYIWYVEGKYNNGEPFKKVGDVTLLH